MKGVKENIERLPVGTSILYKNLSKGDVDSISTTVSSLNADFERRKANGRDTTFCLSTKRDDKKQCYHCIITRYDGLLPKQGGRYIRPVNPLLAD